MPEKFDHQAIEKKWQQRWQDEHVFAVHLPSAAAGRTSPRAESEADDTLTGSARGGRTEKYVLDMFPYPSGDGLHVGHPEGYTATDIYSRYLRMNGKTVLHPMGWDAFGLPAENAAIKKKTHPRIVTEQNINNFKRQILSIGFSYDWDREINTTDPKYYKWTQWIFLQLFKKGLAYEKEAPIWWCPKDKTGLANEEVVNGCCERCGTKVERKMLRQWVLKITDYAERLLSGLDKLDWPESIKALQRNWIGKSEGAEVQFDIVGKRYVLLHGYTGGPDKHMFPWLKKELESRGAEVILPKLPNADDPIIADQVEHVLQHVDFDEHTILVGHSLGGVVALKVLERLKRSVQQTILVSSYIENNFLNNEPFEEQTFDWKFDMKKIRQNMGKLTVLRETTDEIVPHEAAEKIRKALGGSIIDITGTKPHAWGEKEPGVLRNCVRNVTVFTTRPDTLFGATYLVLSPEHPLVDEITTAEHKPAVVKYKKQVAAKSDLERTALEKEKTGVSTGAYAVNPINKSPIPIWIADYVLMSYGTGAIMAVPAHDERDHTFAKKYTLLIIKVIKPPSVMPQKMAASAGILGVMNDDLESDCWTGEGTMMNSGQFDGFPSEEGREKITSWLVSHDSSRKAVHYKLRDWIFSRQRYWGEPIPLVHCDHCREIVESTPHYLNFYNPQTWQNLLDGRKTIETRALNPEEPDRYFGNIKTNHSKSESYIKGVFKPTGAAAYFRVKNVKVYKSLKEFFADKKALTAAAPNKQFNNIQELEAVYDNLAPGYAEKIRNNGLIVFEVKRVQPGIILTPEKELPVLLPDVEKYQPTGTGESPLAAIDEWVNVTCRVCGHPAKRETNTMPQWAGSCWYYIRFTDPHNDKAIASDEAMKAWLPVELYVGGAEHAVLHLLYARFWHKVLYDAGFIPKEVGDEPFTKLKNQGLILGPDGEKMSKSRGNVINPDEIIEQYGADTLRMYEMFMGPFEDAKPWDTNGIIGVRRFLDKVWRVTERLNQVKKIEGYRNRLLHTSIKFVTEDIEQFKFNTAVSTFMGWLNAWSQDPVPQAEFEIFLKLLSPFAPHVSEELWSRLGHSTLLSKEKWPEFDQRIIDTSVSKKIAIQINGKLRGTVTVPPNIEQGAVEKMAKAEPNVAKYLTGEPKKVIFVKDKLINFVI